ncbi:type II secretion system protein GspC [Sinimarinibacterium sp. CAU 1509]|uniref:type II secretion system protein GspC n=1 Tax=Sinimarinibacterium sp. CAU 1509 TaxID=2562283 RepID=UPI0010AD29D9|nr:type II secretion system protein GspC [Sinimarinibacterium sp. CAU 1509]TJY61133.1 type II secretion system protein GspC [Sinimarinibacterium sp. CAU 1509]
MTQTQTVQQLAALYERYVGRITATANVVLTIVVALLAAQLVWALVPIPEAARWTPAPVQPQPQAAAKTSTTDLSALIDRNLFGAYQAPEQAIAKAENAPDTRLSLTLMGVVADASPEQSRALIASSNGEEKSFSIGDDVTSGVKLENIYADRVLLSRQGQFETLRLDKNAPSRAPAPTSGPDTSSPDASTTAMLSDIRTQILADPTKASNYLRVQPSNVNGQLKGYRIYPGREREAFKQLGLRPGDLVTSVNGVQLDDPQKALQLLGDLSQAGSVSLTIERGGQAQTLSVNFN